jgi:FkbM family methyltransferase
MTPPDLKTRKTREHAAPDGEPFVSYSLNFEDVILHRLFPVTDNGFYVDVGAGHPRFENDTFSFYQRGWRGINVEPNQGFHCALIDERPRDINLQVLLSDSVDDALTYYELHGSGLSTCDVEQARNYRAAGREISTREIPVTTLSRILVEASVDHINILKVDVEGFEEKVLNGNDWHQFRPDVVVVESTYPESPVRRPTNILSDMEQRSYRHVHFDGLNDFYLEGKLAAPEGLTLPPNVFDRFVPREIADLRAQAESLRTHYGEALRVADALAIENQRLLRAGEQMRAELLVLNQLLEQLHTTQEALAGANTKLVDANARLASAYSSLCWRLTAPLRWCDDVQRRILTQLRKRLSDDH